MAVYPSTSRAAILILKQGDVFPPLFHVAEDRRAKVALPTNTHLNSSIRYAVDLTGATSASFIFRRRTAAVVTSVSAPAVIVNPESGELRYDWSAGDTDIDGDYYGEFAVTFPTGIRTFPAEGYIEFTITKDLNT